MKITKKMEEELNKQINAEFYSAYLYLSMAVYLEGQNFSGMAHWMKMQSEEELEHGMKIYKYLFQREGTVVLDRIDKPKTKWETVLEVFKEAYEHEKKVTGMIGELYKLAEAENDYATKVMLNWFVEEQVEEEAQANAIIGKLKLIGESKNGLLILDKNLGQRK